MALAFTVDSIDALPEEQRGLYKEANGKFVLDVDGYEDPTNLKSALAKERKAAGDAAKQVKAWQELGKTPEEISALIESSSRADAERMEKSGDWEKMKSQINDANDLKLLKKDEQIASRDKLLNRYVLEGSAKSAIAEAKGRLKLLLPHVLSSLRMIEEDGSINVLVVDETGAPRVNDKGNPLTPSELIDEMRQSEEFSSAFPPSGVTGGGAHQSSGGGGSKTMKQAAVDALRPKEKAAFFASGGVAV